MKNPFFSPGHSCRCGCPILPQNCLPGIVTSKLYHVVQWVWSRCNVVWTTLSTSWLVTKRKGTQFLGPKNASEHSALLRPQRSKFVDERTLWRMLVQRCM